MSTTRLIAVAGTVGVLAAATFAAGSSAAPGAAQAKTDGLTCEIAAARSGGGTELKGLARAPYRLTVGYTLTISAGGNGNSSNITQSGEVSLTPNQTAVLGTASLGGTGNYTATLALSWPGGQTTCRRSGPA